MRRAEPVTKATPRRGLIVRAPGPGSVEPAELQNIQRADHGDEDGNG